MPPARPAKRNLNDHVGRNVALYCRVSQDKTGDEKSVNEQETEGLAWAERVGATVLDVYRDADRSASRFATKQRENFNRLLEDIKAGKLDGGAIWFWEASRSQRDLAVFAKIRDLCRDHGVIWVLRDRPQDPASSDDMMMAGMLAVIAEKESEQTADRVRRGKEGSALAGRPPGNTLYGYRSRRSDVRPAGIPDDQTWTDGRTKQFVWREPDVFDHDTHALENSPAWVVREIFRRIAAGASLMSIAKDLNRRGIPTARGRRWRNISVRQIACNPHYAGMRIHRGKILDGRRAAWPPLIDPETYWACQRILSDPTRITTDRRGRAYHLASGIVRCGRPECGGAVSWQRASKTSGSSDPNYVCRDCRNTFIKQAVLDEYVERVVIRWLERPDVYAWLTQGDNSAAAAQARADAEQLRSDLAEWRRLAKAGKVSPMAYAEVEQDRLARLADAERRERETTLPPVLAGVIGPEAGAKWAKLDLSVQRQILKTVADIRVHPVGASWHKYTVADRVEWHWRLAEGDRQPWSMIGSLDRDPEIRRHLVENPTIASNYVARLVGCQYAVVERVRRELEAAGTIPVLDVRQRENGVTARKPKRRTPEHCTVDGCRTADGSPRPAHSRGLCQRHYDQDLALRAGG